MRKEDMTNLLSETASVLNGHGKATADVAFVVCGTRCGTWEDFAKIADFEYDSGYGGNEISEKLYVVGENWWLERGEYDGSEWWEYKAIPIKPDKALPLDEKLQMEGYGRGN